MTDLGIASHGPKPLLMRRHTEWRNLWNANCDSSRPRGRRELKDDLDRWERTHGSGGGNERGAEVMKKDFDGNGWARSHKSEFDELIANARSKRESPGGGGKVGENGDHDGQKPETDGNVGGEAHGRDGDAKPRRTPPQKEAEADIMRPMPRPSDRSPAPPHSRITTTPGFNLAASLAPTSTALPVNSTHPSSPTATATVSTTLDNYADGGREVKIWRAEGGVRRKPMFDMPGDPVVDAEMGGSADGDGSAR